MLLNSTPQPHEAPALPSEYQWPSVLIPGTCFQRTVIVGSNFPFVNSCKPHQTNRLKVYALCMTHLKPVSVDLTVRAKAIKNEDRTEKGEPKIETQT